MEVAQKKLAALPSSKVYYVTKCIKFDKCVHAYVYIQECDGITTFPTFYSVKHGNDRPELPSNIEFKK